MSLTRPKAAQINFDLTNISDPVIRLNSDKTDANDTDVGFIFERGSTGDNAVLIWDESADQFVLGTTTATGVTQGDLTVTNGNIQVDRITNREQRYTTSNMMKFNQLYTGAAAGSYFTQNEYQKIVTIIPSGDAENYQVSGRILCQTASSIQTINFIAGLRSETLPDLNWSISYTEEHNGTAHFKPQLWTKETTTAGFIFAIQKISSGELYGTVTVDLDVIPRSSSQLANVTVNTTQDSEQTSIDAGYTANDMTLVRSISGSDIDITAHDGSSNGLKLGGTLITATATELNYLDGVTGITLGTANELLIVGSDGTSIISDSTLSIDTGSNYIGINQSSPEVTLHMTGEGAQTAQIRMEQYNDSADAPDVRTRRYRGTIASPSAVSSGDYLFRSNHEYYNGSALIVGGTFAFDNTNDANRTQFAVSVTTDGTSADANTPSKVQFKIDGNDSGAITFNNAYKFPTSDGSANQILQTNGSGVLSFTGSPTFSGATFTGAVLGTDLTLSGNLTVGVTNYNSKEYVLYGSTSDATETEIFVGGTASSRVPIANNTTIFYQVYVVARRTDATGESAGIHLKGVVDNFSGTVADVGDVYEVIVARDDSNYLVDARADDTNDAIGIHVTGVASKTISWTAIVKTHEVAQ
jgi:hypothetical protein